MCLLQHLYSVATINTQVNFNRKWRFNWKRSNKILKKISYVYDMVKSVSNDDEVIF